jgi:hypothetical protein
MNPFEKQIDFELDWRFDELASIKIQIANTVRNSQAEISLLRAAWALLYAHYEGFIKTQVRAYLELIENSQASRAILSEPLVLFSLKREFSRLRSQCSDFELFHEGRQNFPTGMATPIQFERNPQKEIKLPGENSLTIDAVVECLELIGVSVKFVTDERQRLNSLVFRRHEIAHGNKSLVRDREEYYEFARIVTSAMVEFAIKMVEVGEKMRLQGIA